MKTEGQTNSRMFRVLIVDDHPAVRQGLGVLLEPEGVTVCAEADGQTAALDACRCHHPDVVLVDLSLGDEDGVALLLELRELGLPSVAYSMHEDSGHVKRAFAAGALGYVTKREVHRVLVQAVSEVAAGRKFVSPRAALGLADQAVDDQNPNGLSELSRQEQEVYRLLGIGETTKGIASAMKISTRTVESYFDRILVKLNLAGMHELRRRAISHQRDNS